MTPEERKELNEAREDAANQRLLAQHYMEAFASRPDQVLADALEDRIATLKDELASARSVLTHCSSLYHDAMAKRWLDKHPA